MENKHKIWKPALAASTARVERECSSYHWSFHTFWVLMSASSIDVCWRERGMHTENLYFPNLKDEGEKDLFYFLFSTFDDLTRNIWDQEVLLWICVFSARLGDPRAGPASVPESLTFGWDQTLFFLSLFLSYVFLTFFSFSVFLFLGPPTQEGHRAIGEDPEDGRKDNHR